MSKKQVEASQRPFAYGILALFFLNILLFGDVLFNGNGRILSSAQADLFFHFTAWRQFGFDQLRQGHLVLWNPHYLCGSPFLGNFESALLYPFNLIFLIFPLAVAINVSIVFHVFLAGLFTYLWAQHRGLHPLSCFVAGTIFMFGGAYFLHVFAGHLPNLCAMIWAPLIFLTIDGLIEKFSIFWILLGIFAVAMQILSGHPQYVYFTAIGALIYTLFNLVGSKVKHKVLGNFVAIYAGASILTAVQLWTGIRAFQECARHIPLEFNKASSFSFPLQNLLTLVLPEFFGNLTNVHYWSQWFLWEVSLYIGIGAFFLMLMGVISGARGIRKWVLTTTVIIFLFSLGSFTPLYHFFYHFIPLFDGMRGICKFNFLVGLFLAMLSGIGLDFLIKNKMIPKWTFFVTGVAGFIFFCTEILILNSVEDGPKGDWGKWLSSISWLKGSFSQMDLSQKENFIRDAGLHSSFSLFLGGCSWLFLTFLFFFRKLPSIIIFSTVGLVVVELFIFARLNRPTFEVSLLQKKFDQIQKRYQDDPGDYRVYGTGSAALVTGGFDIWEDEPMILGRYGRFVCYSQGLLENQLFSVLPIFKRFHSVFGMMRLKYRVFMDQDPVQFNSMPFKPLPRMLLLNHWEVRTEGNQILPALFESSFNPHQKVYLEKDPDLRPGKGKALGTVEWKDISTDEIEIKANVPEAALLLITDNYGDGWRGVALEGSVQASYQVQPANYFLRAIPLSAGRHHFILEYRPLAFVIGKWVSVFSCLVYFGILIFYFLKKNGLF